MSIHLILAYGVFCAVPLGLALSIALRRRRVERAIARSTQPYPPPSQM